MFFSLITLARDHLSDILGIYRYNIHKFSLRDVSGVPSMYY